MTNIYFKDEEHKRQANFIVKKFNKKSILDDVEYGSFAYLVGAVYKAKQIEKAVDEDGIDLDMLSDIMGVFSHSEKVMIRFGLQCFNGSIDDIKLSDVMRPLDEYNTVAVVQAINIRY